MAYNETYKEGNMSVIVKRLSGVVLWLLEAVLWVFVLKTFEKGYKQLKSWRSKPETIEA
jgi:succinate dehydrogenase hydrophobic anchor subunit